jgi:cyclophilin family peptidyl-prolyl cis-trans isomerase
VGLIAVAIVLVLGAVLAVTLLVRSGGDDDEASSDSIPSLLTSLPPTSLSPTTAAPAAPHVGDTAFGTAPCAPASVDAPVRDFEGAPQRCIDPTHAYAAVVTTGQGSFTIELDVEHSPITVNNFVTLARYRYYDGTGCHRVIENFVVQCGRPGDDETAPGYTIPDELPALGDYAEGVVAMANTGLPDSGGGQWFIITGTDGASLPPQYSIVGRVTEGYATTVAALAALADPLAPNGVPPREPIDIVSIEIVEG